MYILVGSSMKKKNLKQIAARQQAYATTFFKFSAVSARVRHGQLPRLCRLNQYKIVLFYCTPTTKS